VATAEVAEAPAADAGAKPEDGINPLVAEQSAEIDAQDFVPSEKPGEGAAALAAAAETRPLVDLKPAEPATQALPGPGEAAVADANNAEPAPIVPAAAPRPIAGAAAVAPPAISDPATAKISFAPPADPKKKGFLSSFFSPKAQAAPVMSAPVPEKPKPVIQLAAIDPAEKEPSKASLGVQRMDALPGVRQSSLFEIKRRDSLDDDSDVDVHEDEETPQQYASAAGLARLAPNGLLKQRENVDVACLKPSLVRMLKQIEQRFGKRLVVTSGYRSPEYNKRVRGARRSMHMYCAAADIQLEGISKWDLATYVRSMPGRGGVGTYCHTNSVHVDVGPERDWNWKCRRRKS
jgi:uncharacterized protein YcbK (DUF882 family)